MKVLQALGHKTWKDSLTLELYDSNVGHIGKKYSTYWVKYYQQFQAFITILNVVPEDKGKLLY